MPRQFYYCIFLLIALWGAEGIGCSALFGQETDLNDSNTVYPFKGELVYKLSYSYKKGPDVRAFLPDTLHIQVQYPYLRAIFSGGLSDTLLHEIRFDAIHNQLLLVDQITKTLYSIPVDSSDTLPLKRPIATGLKEKIAGFSGSQFSFVHLDGTRDLYYTSPELFFSSEKPDSGTMPSSQEGKGEPTVSEINFRRNGPAFLIPLSGALPLQQVRKSGDKTTTTTLVKVIPGEFPAAFFSLPEGYKRTEFKPRGRDRYPLIGNQQ